MRLDNTYIIARREFLVRLKTKGFWLATVLLPVFMGAMLVLPSLFIAKTRASERLAVVDTTGRVAEAFAASVGQGAEEGSRTARIEVEVIAPAADEEAQRATLERRLLDDELDSWLWIDAASIEDGEVRYYGENIENVLTQQVLRSALTEVIQDVRMADAGYDSAEIRHLTRRVSLNTIQVSESGSREVASGAGTVLALALFFALYIVIIAYGQQVLQGVLEEKTSRVVEVVVSSVSAVEMMAGKLLGICCLGLVQLAVWLGTAAVLLGPGAAMGIVASPEGFTLPAIPISLILHFFFLFLIGFFTFCTFYAMIGSAFNEIQEAQQLSSVAILFVVAPVVFLFPVINDPDSTLAVVTSMLPPFTPLVMLLRVAIKTPPLWQIATAYALNLAFIGLLIWVAARIYRVGILMYGKKPTIPEIIRWVRYS